MLTKGAIGNLVNRYKAVLKKCNLINTFGSLAVASMLVLGGAGVAEAAEYQATGEANATLADVMNSAGNGDIITITATHGGNGLATVGDNFVPDGLTIDFNGNEYIQNGDLVGSTDTVTQAAQFKSGNIITMKNGSFKTDGTASVLIQNYSDLTIENMELDGSNLVDAGWSTLSHNNGSLTVDSSKIYARADGYALDVYYWPKGSYGDAVAEVTNSEFYGRVLLSNDGTNPAENGGKLELSFNNSSISNQNGGTNGGAIEVLSGKLAVIDSTFINNVATSTDENNGGGGAIYSKDASITVNGTEFTENNATGSTGGALRFAGTTNAVVTDSTFTNNSAKYYGAISAGTKSTLTVTDSTFIGNTAETGGAIGVFKNTTITNSTFTENKATNGDGGAVFFGSVSNSNVSSIDGTTFENNSASADGGAIATRKGDEKNNNSGASLSVAATFNNNSAGDNGGAIYNTFYAGDNGVAVNSIFTGNTAGKNGGAIYNEGTNVDNQDGAGIMTITDSTFTGNTAGGLGGAIYNSGTLTLSGTNTFSGNTDSTGANDIYNVGTLTIEDDITLAGGITGDGTVTMNNATVTLAGADAGVTGVTSATGVTIKGTGAANDAVGGDDKALLAKITGADGKAVEGLSFGGMDEGLISGAVAADGTKKANTIMQDKLEMSTTAQLAVGRTIMNDVRKRMGDLRDTKEDAGVWMRWDGGKLKGDSGLTNNFNTIQIGGDMLTGIKNVRAGVAAAFTHGDVDHNNGDGEMETYSFSAYGTWMADNGMFADVIARVGFTNTELNVKGNTVDLDNEVLSLSGEYGWRLPICDQFYVEPQVELTYTYVTDADSKIDYATYEIDSLDSLLGRVGMALGWNLPNDRGNVYARASVVHEFLGDSKITGSAFGNTAVYELDGEDTWLEYGIGANVKLTDSTYIWADVERTEGAEIDEEWRGTVGIRYSF